MDAEPGGELGARARDVAQEAVDAVAAAYTSDAGIDVDDQLRAQLASRGIETVDEGWLAEVARRIRSGHEVRVGRSDGSVEAP